MMRLIISGDATNHQKGLDGIYLLGENHVNNHPYWYQQNGQNAIWYNDGTYKDHDHMFRHWFIGPKRFLGGTIAGIWGPQGIDKSPTHVWNGWRYFNGEIWKEATSEITFKDLSPCVYQDYIQYQKNN